MIIPKQTVKLFEIFNLKKDMWFIDKRCKNHFAIRTTTDDLSCQATFKVRKRI